MVAIWLLCYSALCYANTTLAQDMQHYDWWSLGIAVMAGLVGGTGRTILTLIANDQGVGNIRLVLLKDMVVAMVGGFFAFICIQGWNTAAEVITTISLPPVTRDWRVLLIVLAGASRGRWLGVVDRLATDALANASHKLRGGAPASTSNSAVMPLGDKQ